MFADHHVCIVAYLMFWGDAGIDRFL